MDRRQQIIDGAIRSFAREGFHGTSIKKIAAESGLNSPALIYWYFKDKKELFEAVLTQISPLLRNLPSLQSRMDRPPEEILPLIASTYLSTFDSPEAGRLFRIFISEVSRFPESASELIGSLVVAFNFIVAYLEHQVERGTLRPHDSQGAARSFMGSLVGYIMTREVLLPLRAGIPDQEQYIREVVGIFLNGLKQEKIT